MCPSVLHQPYSSPGKVTLDAILNILVRNAVDYSPTRNMRLDKIGARKKEPHNSQL
jgi:hypothetical protein